jgi:hypothetical protein
VLERYSGNGRICYRMIVMQSDRLLCPFLHIIIKKQPSLILCEHRQGLAAGAGRREAQAETRTLAQDPFCKCVCVCVHVCVCVCVYAWLVGCVGRLLLGGLWVANEGGAVGI